MQTSTVVVTTLLAEQTSGKQANVWLFEADMARVSHLLASWKIWLKIESEGWSKKTAQEAWAKPVDAPKFIVSDMKLRRTSIPKTSRLPTVGEDEVFATPKSYSDCGTTLTGWPPKVWNPATTATMARAECLGCSAMLVADHKLIGSAAETAEGDVCLKTQHVLQSQLLSILRMEKSGERSRDPSCQVELFSSEVLPNHDEKNAMKEDRSLVVNIIMNPWPAGGKGIVH